MFTKFCAALSKISLVLAVLGLLSVVLCVQWQVFGRYVLNDTPTWAEALAMLIVLFVTAFGLGVGVRDAGHIGMESLIVLLPEKWRVRLELVIHSLVAVFGFLMVQSGWMWASAKWQEKKQPLPVLTQMLLHWLGLPCRTCSLQRRHGKQDPIFHEARA